MKMILRCIVALCCVMMVSSTSLVAQDISEKEAFALAKDLGTERAWNAFLIKFPSGFRAELARSYVDKLRTKNGGGATVTTQQPTPAPTPTVINTPRPNNLNFAAFTPVNSLIGSYKIVSRQSSDTYLNVYANGSITTRRNDLDRSSSRWSFQPAQGVAVYANITNQYLGTSFIWNSGARRIETANVSFGNQMAQWGFEQVPDGSGAVYIRNRANPTAVLWMDYNRNQLALSPTNLQSYAAQWFLQLDNNVNNGIVSSSNNGSSSNSSRIICRGGEVRRGRCRCDDGDRRVRRSRNNYRCVTDRASTGSGGRTCYSSGCSDLCGPGYVIIRGKCMSAIDAPCARGKVRKSDGTCVRKSSGSSGGSSRCRNKKPAAWREVCKSGTLTSLDRKLNRVYRKLKNSYGGNSSNEGRQLRDRQRAWIRIRNACGTDYNCIKDAYQSRIGNLQSGNW